MNYTDKQYNDLLNLVLKRGRVKKNRTGIDTLGVFGAQARFNLADGFPLLTTKKVFFKGIVHELLWFLSGSTNIKYLVDNGVNIWNGNCYDRYKKAPSWQAEDVHESHDEHGPTGIKLLSEAEFIERIKTDDAFAKRNGELGEGTYGGMWRNFPTFISSNRVDQEDWQGEKITVDQIQKVMDKLKTNPDDRRLIVSAWHPHWVDNCALPPCHVLFQFHTEDLNMSEQSQQHMKFLMKKHKETGKFIPQLLKDEETQKQLAALPTKRLNCQLYQRSCDLFLGVPFNIASYSLLLQMVAHCSNMEPGDFIHTFGDLHIYTNHLEQVKEQLTREHRDLPQVVLNPEKRNLLDFKFEDIQLVGYDPHPAIKAEMAV